MKTNTVLPPIVEFQCLIINDFENTEFAGRKSILELSYQDLIFSPLFFKEKFTKQKLFRKYLRKIFKKTILKIEREKTFVQEEYLEQWRKFLKLPSQYEYIDYCIDEDTGEYFCRIKIR